STTFEEVLKLIELEDDDRLGEKFDLKAALEATGIAKESTPISEYIENQTTPTPQPMPNVSPTPTPTPQPMPSVGQTSPQPVVGQGQPAPISYQATTQPVQPTQTVAASNIETLEM
ncbi:MAG: hypothetical protein PHP12_02870, partial [Bacilli bacterium]|nr:hypothetical protein [Bacilli bacterium]